MKDDFLVSKRTIFENAQMENLEIDISGNRWKELENENDYNKILF